MNAATLPGRHYGTVGVVAMDRRGDLAAGTSTGGSQGKMPGRVGDSPILGAGTYASNESCAVSATGVGEYFMRLTVARDVCALVQYRGMALKAAADQNWHPTVIMNSVSVDPSLVDLAGGAQNVKGVISDYYYHQFYETDEPSVKEEPEAVGEPASS